MAPWSVKQRSKRAQVRSTVLQYMSTIACRLRRPAGSGRPCGSKVAQGPVPEFNVTALGKSSIAAVYSSTVAHWLTMKSWTVSEPSMTVRMTSARSRAKGLWFCLSVPSHFRSLSMVCRSTTSGTGFSCIAAAAWSTCS